MRKKISILVLSFVLIMSSSRVFADYSTAHVFKGYIRGGPSNIAYWKDYSVDANGFGDIVNHALTNWDAVSSQVGFTQVADAASAGMKVFITFGELPAGVFGATDYWGKNIFGGWDQILPNDIIYNNAGFDMARVRLDATRMASSNFTWSNKVKTTGHEIGHVLSLFHFEQPPAHNEDNGIHWMRSGQISFVPLA